MTECAAICAYLADAFPDAGLAPPSGNQKRGPYYRWLFFAAGPVEQAVTGKSLGLARAARQEEDDAATAASRDDRRARAGAGAGRAICGDQFTAADVYVGSQIGWGCMFGTIEKRPAFEAIRPPRPRPAAVRAREIDDALVPKQPA